MWWNEDCYETRIKHLNALCGKKVELLDVMSGNIENVTNMLGQDSVVSSPYHNREKCFNLCMFANAYVSRYNPTTCWPIRPVTWTWTPNTRERHFVYFTIQLLRRRHVHLHSKTLTASTFNLRALVLSSYTIFLTHLNIFVSKTNALTLSALWPPEKYTVKQSHILPFPSIALHRHLEETLLSFVFTWISPVYLLDL